MRGIVGGCNKDEEIERRRLEEKGGKQEQNSEDYSPYNLPIY